MTGPPKARMSSGLRDRVHDGVYGLTPGYFALVMGSGIISVGMWLTGYEVLSLVLLVVCAFSYLVLLALTGWRLLAYRAAVADDFSDPRRAFGFFTFIAGTNVLGVRLALDRHYGATAVLLVVAAASWLALGYIIPWTAVLGGGKRPVIAAANGTWFIWVVASQSSRSPPPPSNQSSPRQGGDWLSRLCSHGRSGLFFTPRPGSSSLPA